MKKELILIILYSLFSLYGFAQENIPFMQCHYAERYKRYLDKDRIWQDEMVLRISQETSEFFSLWQRERSKVQDSLIAKGASLNDVMAAREKIPYPISTEYAVIYKHYPQRGKLTHTDNLFRYDYQYTEELLIPSWEILDEQQEVAGYMCQRAEADFLGRRWIAWFTPEIPVQDGPWKLCGLPGLILQAEDSEGHYQYKCIEIKQVAGLPPIEIPKKNYIKCDKEKYLRDLKEKHEDFSSFAKKQGVKGEFTTIGKDGKERPSYPIRKYNCIER